ncbi:Eco57I restriction-modification methylase domain-containing protein [sulfur-oxidizing endosymbiont of Gigantopelta aegis]|uniref:Eco57I restriction-modification methylase domain-containing protein n=2 Tax=sulfur-oxidizing endosymbiont of Gigantopelta aegis TaxID=2794934 RepID=UPI001BE457B5|nr:hypothetical protein [sulfur-oxidizing endosymbiont of Gigantopelta aegis]
MPSELAFDRSRLDSVFLLMDNLVSKSTQWRETEKKLIQKKLITSNEMKEWRSPLKHTYEKILDLHERNWNGIWFRIVRNFFWSAIAGKFDVVVGNPPWVRWSKLPELYRERIKPTCDHYGIFSKTKFHGGNELDISGMITYTVADKWLKDEDGILAFVITQTHFQSPSSAGFRSFYIGNNQIIQPVGIDDLKALKPFPDAANKTAIFIAKNAKVTQ